jgi:hypothetical protein
MYCNANPFPWPERAPCQSDGQQFSEILSLWDAIAGREATIGPISSKRPKGSDNTMRTQAEIEAAICDATRHFAQEYTGRGPNDIHAYLINNVIFVRLRGVLTAATQGKALTRTAFV